MTLTISNGPLSHDRPGTANYDLEGPRNKILFTPFPRRVRAVFADATLMDTERGMLLYESGILPVLYVPIDDVNFDLLTKTDHSTHCPYKGDASYWTITAGDRTSENSVWGYESPLESAPWLEGYVAPYFGRMDQWFDEDEEVFGHLRDPYHRVDIRPTSRTVTVSIGDEVVAESSNASVLSETGLPNRFYIPEADVRTDRFIKSETTTHCPYKGDTDYWTFAGPKAQPDVAWSYPQPFDESGRIGDHWSFLGDDVEVVAT